MRIGFTGTQRGMNLRQMTILEHIFQCLEGDEEHHFHHGGCIGADAQAHEIACKEGMTIILHPSNIEEKQAVLKWPNTIYDRKEEKPPLERNHDIVDSVDLLIVAPAQDCETIRSGTWATYRYAKRKGVPTLQIWRGES